MKKFLAVLLSAVLLFSLAACSDKQEEIPAETGTDAPVQTTLPQEPETTAPAEEEDKIIFNGTTVIDDKYSKVEITTLTKGLYGNELTVELENKTSDMELYFGTGDCSINGVHIDPFFGQNVAAGKKAKASILLDDEALTKNGITEYTDIKLSFHVSDASDILADNLTVKTVSIYPYGQDKAHKYVRQSEPTDISVISNDNASATVIGWGEDDFYGYALELYLENKSADTDYTFSISACAVNGVEIIPFGAYDVPAGNVAFESLGISSDVLDEQGITDYTDIYLSIRVFDSASWDADDIAEQDVHIYPEGEDKAVPFVREIKDTDTVVADNESFTVIITGMDENDLFDTTDLCYYLINKTDSKIMFSMQDVSVNGYMMDPFFAVTVNPGFSRFYSASWYDDELEENSIDEIENIEFTMVAADPSDWDKPDYLNEKVVYNP